MTLQEKIRQEIERLQREVDDHNYYLDIFEQVVGYTNALLDIENFLNTLSEEPNESLEEEAEEWAENEAYGKSNAEFEMAYKGFIAGWKCRDDQMPMPEDTVLFNKGVAEGRRLEREDMLKDAVETYYGYVNNTTRVFLPEKTLKGVKEGYNRIIILKEGGETK